MICRTKLAAILLLQLGAAVCQPACAETAPVAFRNPLWTNEVYDASWMRTADGTYYLVSTEREVLKSRDFANWELAACAKGKRRILGLPVIVRR